MLKHHMLVHSASMNIHAQPRIAIFSVWTHQRLSRRATDPAATTVEEEEELQRQQWTYHHADDMWEMWGVAQSTVFATGPCGASL